MPYPTQRLARGRRHVARQPRSPAHMAARGEDDANRRPQRHERVPPGSPKGGSGDGSPARAVLKWRLKGLSNVIISSVVVMLVTDTGTKSCIILVE